MARKLSKGADGKWMPTSRYVPDDQRCVLCCIEMMCDYPDEVYKYKEE